MISLDNIALFFLTAQIPLHIIILACILILHVIRDFCFKEFSYTVNWFTTMYFYVQEFKESTTKTYTDAAQILVSKVFVSVEP